MMCREILRLGRACLHETQQRGVRLVNAHNKHMIKLTITTKNGATVSLDIPDDESLDISKVLEQKPEGVQDWLKGSPEPSPLEQKLAEQIVEEVIEVQKSETQVFDLDHTVETALDQFQFPTQGGGIYTPPMQLTRDFVMAFGEEHVTKEFLKARSWLLANPEKRKTLRGMGRYLNSWLCHEAGMKRTAIKKVAAEPKTGSLLDNGNTDSQGW